MSVINNYYLLNKSNIYDSLINFGIENNYMKTVLTEIYDNFQIELSLLNKSFEILYLVINTINPCDINDFIKNFKYSSLTVNIDNNITKIIFDEEVLIEENIKIKNNNFLIKMPKINFINGEYKNIINLNTHYDNILSVSHIVEYYQDNNLYETYKHKIILNANQQYIFSKDIKTIIILFFNKLNKLNFPPTVNTIEIHGNINISKWRVPYEVVKLYK